MFVPITEKERYDFLHETSGSFIPGYTGHCPTLRFHYGKCYGTETKEISRDLNDKAVYKDLHKTTYRVDDYDKFTPIERSKGQSHDYARDVYSACPKYILGYTGFIPTLNFRYGKSFGRSADDSVSDFNSYRRRSQERRSDMQRTLRAKSAPRVPSIRHRDDVDLLMKNYEECVRFKEKQISPSDPPIAGYTGHIPGVNGNEQSLSQRYSVVVGRGLTFLKDERERQREKMKTKYKIEEILANRASKYGGV